MNEKDPFQIHFRLPKEIAKRVDKHIQRLCEQTPGLEFSRTDAVLTLIARGLDAVEKVEK